MIRTIVKRRPLAGLVCLLTLLLIGSDGNADPEEVTLSLPTDSSNQSVIQMSGARTSINVPKQGLQFPLTITLSGSTASTPVEIKQVQGLGGTGLVNMGGSGTATSATVNTSGGTPNTAQVILRGAVVSSFQNDFKLQAFVNGQERAVKFSTVIKVDLTPRCLYLADQRPVQQTATVTPAIEGLDLVSQTWAVDRLQASPTTQFAAPPWPLTNAQGQATRTFRPIEELLNSMNPFT